MITVRRSFIGLHVTLGLVILIVSVRTLIHAWADPADHLHLGAVATLETLAALLFLWPRTLRIGGAALVAILLTAAAAHAVRGEFPAAPLVYAAAALFVTVHGSAWPSSGHQAAA